MICNRNSHFLFISIYSQRVGGRFFRLSTVPSLLSLFFLSLFSDSESVNIDCGFAIALCSSFLYFPLHSCLFYIWLPSFFLLLFAAWQFFRPFWPACLSALGPFSSACPRLCLSVCLTAISFASLIFSYHGIFLWFLRVLHFFSSISSNFYLSCSSL